MEFENLHEHVAWLGKELAAVKSAAEALMTAPPQPNEMAALEARVSVLESRLSAADNLAKAAMAEIKEHEAETVNGKTDKQSPQSPSV